MTWRIRRLLTLGIGITLVVPLTGCGSRLSYSQVLSENAALDANGTKSTAGTQVSNSSGLVGAGDPVASGSSNSGPAVKNGLAPAIGAVSGSTNVQSGGSTSARGGTGRSGGIGTGAGAQQPSSSGGGLSNGVSPSGPATGSTVNVGQIGSDSGLLGNYLGQARVGVQIWTDYINQHGGLNGHKVNAITADDGGDPSTALSEAQAMVQQDHVIAFIANDNALTTPTIAPYLEKMKVPTIGGLDIEPQWFSSPDFFPGGASIRVTVDAGMKAGIDSGNTRIGIVACVEFALICSNAANVAVHDAPLLGGQVVYNSNASLAQPDFTSLCLAAKGAGVNNWLVAMDPGSVTRLTTDCANQGYRPRYFTDALVLINYIVTQNTVGLLAASPIFPYSVVTPATAQFDQAVQQTTGGAPTSEFEAMAWVAGLILQTAATGLPPANPTSINVLAGLQQIKSDSFGGLTSPMTYTAGQATTSPTCYFMLQVQAGRIGAPNGLARQCLPASFAPFL